MNSEVENMLNRLEHLTKDMDVPEFRRNAVNWLSRNLAIRNSTHPQYPEAKKIVNKLAEMGVH